MVAGPIRMADAGTRSDGVPPLLGQDTEAVLESIGIGAAERAALAADGVI